jgi:hypothetical protein
MKLAGQPLFAVFRFVFSSFRVFVIFQDLLGKTVAIRQLSSICAIIRGNLEYRGLALVKPADGRFRP